MLFPPNVCMFAAHLPTWGCRRDHAHHLEDARAIAAATGCAALVCLPLVDGAATAGSADAPPCLGALTLGFASEADVNGAALKAALLLARALVTEQRQALLDVAGLVSQMLLPAPAPASGPAAAGGSGGEGGAPTPAGGEWSKAQEGELVKLVEDAEERKKVRMCARGGACERAREGVWRL